MNRHGVNAREWRWITTAVFLCIFSFFPHADKHANTTDHDSVIGVIKFISHLLAYTVTFDTWTFKTLCRGGLRSTIDRWEMWRIWRQCADWPSWSTLALLHYEYILGFRCDDDATGCQTTVIFPMHEQVNDCRHKHECSFSSRISYCKYYLIFLWNCDLFNIHVWRWTPFDRR